MNEEVATAVTEVAKTTGKAIDAGVKLGAFFGKIVGPTLVEAGGITHDWMKYFREANLLRLKDKVDAIHARRGLEGKTVPIPPKYVFPILTGASLEDDDSLQDMWAALIANATDPTKLLDLRKIFSELLASIEPLDAKILRYLNSQGWRLMRDMPGGGITLAILAQATAVGEEKVRISLQNLHRLGLLVDEFVARAGGPFEPDAPEFGTTSFARNLTAPKTIFRPSSLGVELLKVCER